MAGGGLDFCSVHGKKRRAQCLVDDGSGGKMCAPGQTCQIGSEPGEPNETYMCSIHGKKRSAKCLTLDESGSMRCAPGFECQVNGSGGGGLKGGLKRSAG